MYNYNHQNFDQNQQQLFPQTLVPYPYDSSSGTSQIPILTPTSGPIESSSNFVTEDSKQQPQQRTHQPMYRPSLPAPAGHVLDPNRNKAFSDNPPVLYPPSIPIPIDQHLSHPYPLSNHPMASFGSGPPNPYGFPQYSNAQFPNHYPYPYPVQQRHPQETFPNYYQPQQIMNQPYPPGYPGFPDRANYSSINNFKPTQTKKNSRPRINKLHSSEQVLKRVNLDLKKKYSKNSHQLFTEPSLDEIFDHFQDTLKIGREGLGSSYSLKINSSLEAQLMDLFIQKLSKCIDIFLLHDAFGKVVAELALYDETGMLLDSIFCLSSLMLHRKSPHTVDASLPIKYYHQSIKSIRYYLSIPGIEDNEKGIISRCLLSTIILCIYELFFVAVDSTYVKGASSILTSILSRNKTGKSILKNSPFYHTCFWAIFLCDTKLSLKYDLPSMYSVEKFWSSMDPEYFEEFNRPSHVDLDTIIVDEDEIDTTLEPEELAKQKYDKYISDSMLNKQDTMWWLYKSLFIYSAISDFNKQVEVITKEEHEMNQPFHDWLNLRARLDEFERYMPLNLKPTIYKPACNQRSFPIIFFKDEATAMVSLNFKLAKMQLYEALLLKTNQFDPMVKQELDAFPPNFLLKVSKDVVGIIKTYDSSTVIWPVNVHAIRQVSKVFPAELEEFKGLESLVERMIQVCNLRLHKYP